MPDQASINRSLNTIRTELEYLQQSGALAPPQFQSIMAQLPASSLPGGLSRTGHRDMKQGNGQPSQYTDPRYNPHGAFDPSKISQEAQDPNHPAHPQNPKHHDWVKKMATKFGNAAVFGAGATFGGDLVNDVMRKF